VDPLQTSARLGRSERRQTGRAGAADHRIAADGHDPSGTRYGLLALAGGDGPRLTEQIKSLRRTIATDMGFVLPPVRIQDNMRLGPAEYVISVKEIEAGRGELRPLMLLVMDPKGGTPTMAGEATREPSFGLPPNGSIPP